MNKDNNEINLLQTLVCDDIRREDNGKLLLIGFYPAGIFMNVLPAEIPLSILMQFEIQIKEETSLEFEVKGDALQGPVKFSLVIDDKNFFGNKQSVPFIAKCSLKIKEVGSFAIYYRKVGAKKWALAGDVTINRNVNLTQH